MIWCLLHCSLSVYAAYFSTTPKWKDTFRAKAKEQLQFRNYAVSHSVSFFYRFFWKPFGQRRIKKNETYHDNVYKFFLPPDIILLRMSCGAYGEKKKSL